MIRNILLSLLTLSLLLVMPMASFVQATEVTKDVVINMGEPELIFTKSEYQQIIEYGKCLQQELKKVDKNDYESVVEEYLKNHKSTFDNFLNDKIVEALKEGNVICNNKVNNDYKKVTITINEEDLCKSTYAFIIDDNTMLLISPLGVVLDTINAELDNDSSKATKSIYASATKTYYAFFGSKYAKIHVHGNVYYDLNHAWYKSGLGGYLYSYNSWKVKAGSELSHRYTTGSSYAVEHYGKIYFENEPLPGLPVTIETRLIKANAKCSASGVITRSFQNYQVSN